MANALSVSIALALSSALAAQTTWVVDANNGPGTNYLDLPPAVAAAAAGDTIIVRAASIYSGFSTSKGLTIVGEGPCSLARLVSGAHVVRVDGLPANETFVMAGPFTAFYGNGNGGGGFAFVNAQGRVHLQGLSTFASQLGVPVLEGLLAQDCASVTATGCSFAGIPAVRAANSNVDLVDTTLRGSNAESGFGLSLAPSGPGLIAQGGTVHLSRCTVIGGNGGTTFLGYPIAANSVAAWISTSTVYVTGTGADQVAAGSASGFGAAAAISNDGRLEIDPNVVLLGSLGAPGIVGTGTTVTRRIVSLTVGGGQLGGTVDAEVVSPVGDLVALFVGRPILPTPGPWGPIHVDLATAVPLAFAVPQPNTERIQRGFNVPNNPAFAGITLAHQAIDLYQSTGTLEMSNAAVVVVR